MLTALFSKQKKVFCFKDSLGQFDRVPFQSGCQRVVSDIFNGCNYANELGKSILVVDLFSHQILALI